MNDGRDRRAFLRAAMAAGAAWATASLVDVEEALACAGQQASRRGAAATPSALSAAQVAALEAATARADRPSSTSRRTGTA